MTRFDIVTEIINKWDPIGLLEGGAPLNEYSIEVRKIVISIDDISNHFDLAKAIQMIFFESTESKVDVLKCLNYSEEIWNRINK